MGYKFIDEYLTNGDGMVLENDELIEDFNVWRQLIWSIEIYGTTFMSNKLWSYISKVQISLWFYWLLLVICVVLIS
jgi:hypothetical protein